VGESIMSETLFQKMMRQATEIQETEAKRLGASLPNSKRQQAGLPESKWSLKYNVDNEEEKILQRAYDNTCDYVSRKKLVYIHLRSASHKEIEAFVYDVCGLLGGTKRRFNSHFGYSIRYSDRSSRCSKQEAKKIANNVRLTFEYFLKNSVYKGISLPANFLSLGGFCEEVYNVGGIISRNYCVKIKFNRYENNAGIYKNINEKNRLAFENAKKEKSNAVIKSVMDEVYQKAKINFSSSKYIGYNSTTHSNCESCYNETLLYIKYPLGKIILGGMQDKYLGHDFLWICTECGWWKLDRNAMGLIK